MLKPRPFGGAFSFHLLRFTFTQLGTSKCILGRPVGRGRKKERWPKRPNLLIISDPVRIQT